eukprot:TRINITY_DN12846_c0_g1_i1.p1 TRINITY_DN12846_c0_g1~~TRINITY_DN12846_c0_g1_i1.p1  ORF type:complete len:678 (-),score=131.45 TRINITY_DN12846_c0_g1_i1:164-2197(-)
MTTHEPDLSSLRDGLPLSPLPARPVPLRDESLPHAPAFPIKKNAANRRLALQNALRYIPSIHHEELAQELLEEYDQFGHIYMYRFKPPHDLYEMKAHPLKCYPAKTRQAASVMLMIMNNLNPEVAQYPHELVTYGGNGNVLQNWAQYHLVMKYLANMSDEQTLTLYSGHPMGLFPSSRDAPRLVITNGMVIPNYSSRDDYLEMQSIGVSMYGQMTAGSFCYIGPQGIVHGTTLTLLNASRKYLGTSDMAGKVFLTAGLGGMSGAQAKAAVICGAICVVAEVNASAVKKRHAQGWVMEAVESVDEVVTRVREARKEGKPLSLAYTGNVVDLWERFAAEDDEQLIDLGSDQTSCHNPFNGGYYPVSLSFEEANKMMVDSPEEFVGHVQRSLIRHVAAINKLCARGVRFWDYGNSFLLEAGRAKADIFRDDGKTFKYPSYVQDIMGDIFSLGFGPFRWVCTSGLPSDLLTTDRIAAEQIQALTVGAPPATQSQYADNLLWIQQADKHKLVVGSQARILYSDAEGRRALAKAFNDAVRSGELAAPVVISRDHHDVSGTDSPFRETSNITDGSMFTADMAVQNYVGDAIRGATWVALHNGGGTGWGEAINGGFGLVLDGTADTERRALSMLHWDVMNGVARRAWAGNDNAAHTLTRAMGMDDTLVVTVANRADASLLDRVCK